ncbi:hypothetical protein C2S51_020464, partial [Perilla frutescens var. frutescens]
MMSATSISANTNNILLLNGSNFKDWKDNILIILGCMDLDYSLRVNKPASLMDASSADEKWNFDKWDHLNHAETSTLLANLISLKYKGKRTKEVEKAAKDKASVPGNTWWLDSGATTHISVSMQVFLEDVEFRERNKVRDITFEEVSVSTPTTSDDLQASIPVISREVDLEPQQDNIENLPTRDNTIIQKEQPQQPQELMPLRRSTRDRRNAIPDDYE